MKQKGDVTCKVIKKVRYDSESLAIPVYFYGIAVYKENKEWYRPVYPFSCDEKALPALREFVEAYQEELQDFYKEGYNYDFSRHVCGITGDSKDKFRERWFKRGVIIF